MSAEPTVRKQTRPAPWRDVRVLRVVGQILFLVAVFLFLSYLYNNFQVNAARSRLSTNFNFLDRPAGVDIRDTAFRRTQPVRDALRVGLVNTMRVAGVGITLATLLGTILGVARLSTNWLVRKAAALYVESIRNIPVVVIIIFFYTAVVLKLPPISEPMTAFNTIVFSNRGLVVPWGEGQAGARTFLLLCGVALLAAVAVGWWRSRRFDATGQPHHRILFGFLTFLAITVVVYLALNGPVRLSIPSREGRIVTGGIKLGPEYAALLIALVLYTSSHIAEIVRGSILAVPKGQTEAANAIALSSFQRLRYVILPQAMRIMVPPLGNQYLNLTKNSSLAVFIGYPEIFLIGQNMVANGNPAPQIYLIMMGLYLVLSLGISLIANVVNRRLSLATR